MKGKTKTTGCAVSRRNKARLMQTTKIVSFVQTQKGQSILLTHAILIGFTVFLVYAVTTTFIGIRADYQKFVGNNEVNELCFVMKGAVDKVYINTDYNSPTTTLAGYIDVLMPEKISDLPYHANFANRSVFLQSIDRKFNSTCTIGLNVNYNGTTSGGLTRFSYTRYANGTKTIEMRRL